MGTTYTDVRIPDPNRIFLLEKAGLKSPHALILQLNWRHDGMAYHTRVNTSIRNCLSHSFL